MQPSPSRPVILDHTIVGQSLTALSIRKDREYAGCRICGAIFQSRLNTDTPDYEYTSLTKLAAHFETMRWRDQHNKKHTEREHLEFVSTGRTFSPEAAHKLVPFGLVPINDALDPTGEIDDAMLTAPRVPINDVENAPVGLIGLSSVGF